MSSAQSLSLSPSSSSRGLTIGLWVAQVLLALVFLMAGGTKLTLPMEALSEQMPWVSGAMGGAVRFIGIAEVLGALGLILPAATRIVPRLTGLAALGLTTVMVLAAILHLSRGEAPMVVVNAALGGLGAFIAWGRLSGAPIAPRS
jgi:uncharacterized membrane protein YphA (DoxX/SURF4 family)